MNVIYRLIPGCIRTDCIKHSGKSYKNINTENTALNSKKEKTGYDEDKDLEKKNLIWNMLGSGVYAITSMLLGVIASRILGKEEGGIIFFAFSTLGQQLYIISYFGMRPIQMTDMSFKCSFGDYLRFRMITSAAALAGGIIYSVLFAGSLNKMLIWFSMVLYKVFDGIADCYETEYQRQGRLYMTGKSSLLRTVFSAAVFIIATIITKNALDGSAAFAVSGFISVYIFAAFPLKSIRAVDYSVKKGSILKLFNLSKLLFLSSFVDIYIFAAAKYAVNSALGDEANAYFNTLFIPTSVINLMAGFIIRPALTMLSVNYERGEIKLFNKRILKISLYIAGFTICAMAAAKIMGIRVLSMLLGTGISELKQYENSFLILILGGGFYALLNLFYYILVIIKERNAIFAVYILGGITAYFLSERMAKSAGIEGAAVSYLILMVFVSFMFIAVFLKKLLSIKGEKEYQDA